MLFIYFSVLFIDLLTYICICIYFVCLNIFVYVFIIYLFIYIVIILHIWNICLFVCLLSKPVIITFVLCTYLKDLHRVPNRGLYP